MTLVPRSSVVFLSGLLAAAGLTMATDQSIQTFGTRLEADLALGENTKMPFAERRTLNAEDRRVLAIAWRYIEQNTQPQTGFVDSVAGFPSTTLWDQGSYLFALVGAQKLGLLEQSEFDDRVGRLLISFQKMPLFEGKLPNKAYDTRSLAMVNYQNEASDIGIGWSALDVCRLLMAFRTLEHLDPDYGPEIRNILARWDLAAMSKGGELWGTSVKEGEVLYLQEGRMGYEQYAARAAALWGLDVFQAMSGQRVLEWENVFGVDVPTDRRDAKRFTAISPILSEPYLLQAFELGLDSETGIYASRVFQAQEQRHAETGQLTSVSEDHVNQDPYFLYSSVFADGVDWAVVTESGKAYPELRTVSTKASFGWDALYRTQYTAQLVDAVRSYGNDTDGWPAGIYESDGRVNDVYTLNTNAVIIEALHFSVFGPMWQL